MKHFSFTDFWQAEAIRQREEHYGPVEDKTIILQLRQHHNLTNVTEKIIHRARLIAQRDGLAHAIKQWIKTSQISLFVLFLLAILAGISLGMGALDVSLQRVNILVALVSLLGLHFISLIIWGFSLFIPWHQQTFIGGVWLWLNKKLSHSPDASLAAQAFIHTANQQGGMRWLVSSISHGFWLVVLCIAAITLLALLASKHYGFTWETTILSYQTFISFTQALGTLPSLLGFPMPSAELIAQSSNQVADINDAQKIWSAWLMGQLVVWGILLRLLCFVISVLKTRSCLKNTYIDIESPAYASLIHRLNHPIEKIGIDSTAPSYELPGVQPTVLHTSANSRLIIGLELAQHHPWPPFTLHTSVTDAGKIESREERHQLLAQLVAQPVKELLITCDGQQTPDRGIAYFIRDISQYAQETSIYLLVQQEEKSRINLWENMFSKMGISSTKIVQYPQQLSTWTGL